MAADRARRVRAAASAAELNRRLEGDFPTDASALIRRGVANVDTLTAEDVLTLLGEIEWAKVEISFREEALIGRARDLGISGEDIRHARGRRRVRRRW